MGRGWNWGTGVRVQRWEPRKRARAPGTVRERGCRRDPGMAIARDRRMRARALTAGAFGAAREDVVRAAIPIGHDAER